MIKKCPFCNHDVLPDFNEELDILFFMCTYEPCQAIISFAGTEQKIGPYLRWQKRAEGLGMNDLPYWRGGKEYDC